MVCISLLAILLPLIGVSWQYNFCNDENPVVETKYGAIRGINQVSRLGRTYSSFRGIPYAKPPVGDYRFKAPEPPDSWLQTLDATKDGPYCIQKNYFFANPKVEGQEDCLYLNVYAPKADYPLPVMVWIHWGGFFAGRSTSDYIGPEYIMDKDVILVTFNYRLGVLGFLTTLDDVAPGNYALKDQVQALRWVQENIHNFGGDNTNVTIFGQSAGAGSVHYHLLSPSSRGLFHRAIQQSGSALAVWAALGNSQQPAVLAGQANFVGCGEHVGKSQQLIACLRNVSAHDLLQSQDRFKLFHVDPLTVYTAVSEEKTAANSEPFLTKNPIEYILNGEFANVPWILGLVANEGTLKASELLRSTEIRNDLNAKFESVVINVLFGLALSTNDTKGLYNDIKKDYLLDKDYVNVSNPASVQAFIDAYSDRVFNYGSYQSAMIHSAKGHSPIWFYYFGYRGQYSYGDWFAATKETIDFNWGTSHCDDLLYLFRSPGLFPDLQNVFDLTALEILTDIWTSFAIHGDPNHSKTLNSNLFWYPLNIQGASEMVNENLCLLNFNGSHSEGLTLKTSCGFLKDRMSFWSSHKLNENFEGLH